MSHLEPGWHKFPPLVWKGPQGRGWHRGLASADRAWHRRSFAGTLSMSSCYQLLSAGHPVDNEHVARGQVPGDNEN